jgi:hypothetical protein
MQGRLMIIGWHHVSDVIDLNELQAIDNLLNTDIGTISVCHVNVHPQHLHKITGEHAFASF